jgi:hypothetical protein
MNTTDIPARLRPLAPFAGTWRTTGEILGDAEERLDATDRYEWFPGGHFLVHHVEGRMGPHEVRAIEMIGADPDGDDFVTHAFDNGGNTARYTATLHERAWSIDGETERFRGEFDADWRTLRGAWERLDRGRWERWMTITLAKQDG